MATDLDRSQARQKKKLLFEQNKNTKQEQVLGGMQIDYNTEVDIDRLLYRYRATILQIWRQKQIQKQIQIQIQILIDYNTHIYINISDSGLACRGGLFDSFFFARLFCACGKIKSSSKHNFENRIEFKKISFELELSSKQ